MNTKERVNFSKMNKKSGFSLMELIIVVVIIGVLIAAVVGMAGQKETAKAVAAEQVVMQVSNGAQSWAVRNATENFTNVSLAALKTANLLPASFDDTRANPWGGTISVEVATDGGNPINHYTVTMTNVPTEICQALKAKYLNKATNVNPDQMCTDNGTSSTFKPRF